MPSFSKFQRGFSSAIDHRLAEGRVLPARGGAVQERSACGGGVLYVAVVDHPPVGGLVQRHPEAVEVEARGWDGRDVAHHFGAMVRSSHVPRPLSLLFSTQPGTRQMTRLSSFMTVREGLRSRPWTGQWLFRPGIGSTTPIG